MASLIYGCNPTPVKVEPSQVPEGVKAEEHSILESLALNSPTDIGNIKKSLLVYEAPEGAVPGTSDVAHYLADLLPENCSAVQFFGLADFAARAVGENSDLRTKEPIIEGREIYSGLHRQALRSRGVADIVQGVCPEEFGQNVMQAYNTIWKPTTQSNNID
ncbi:hypothetical protein ACFLZX_00505 [Nanoarchaeota archaeon]